MMHTLSFTYDRRMLRRMYFGDILGRHQAWTIAFGVLLVLGIWLSTSQDTQWPGGVGIGVALAYTIGLFVQYRILLGYVDQPIRIDLSDAGIVVTSPWGVSDIPWRSVSALMDSGIALVLIVRPSGRSVHLPKTALTSDVLSILKANIPKVR